MIKIKENFRAMESEYDSVCGNLSKQKDVSIKYLDNIYIYIIAIIIYI